IGAVEAQGNGNSFLDDVHQPRQDFQFLSRQTSINVQHVGAGLHLLAGNVFEELNIARRRRRTNFLASAVDKFTDNEHTFSFYFADRRYLGVFAALLPVLAISTRLAKLSKPTNRLARA